MYKLVPGVASSSFGMNVAALAGLPKPIVARADAIAHRFASCFDDVSAPATPENPLPAGTTLPPSPSRNLKTALCRRLLLGVQRSTLTPTALGQIHRQCRQMFASHHDVPASAVDTAVIPAVPPSQPLYHVARPQFSPPRPMAYHRPPPGSHGGLHPQPPLRPHLTAVAGRHFVSQGMPRPVIGSQMPPATQTSAPQSQVPFRRF